MIQIFKGNFYKFTKAKSEIAKNIMGENKINPNVLSFIGLANEYCMALSNVYETEKEEFVAEMLRLLPRIYITMSDVRAEELSDEEDYYNNFSSYVDEDYYESIRRGVESIMGEDDTFLETFEEDMKYSDTPIASSVAECLADIFQDLFNFVSLVKESEGEQTQEALAECKENFESYWAQTLCNVMRALNHIRYSLN